MGYKILMRNVTFKGELDIVAMTTITGRSEVGTYEWEGSISIESVGPRKIKALICSGGCLSTAGVGGSLENRYFGHNLRYSNADGYDLEYVKDVTLGMI